MIATEIPQQHIASSAGPNNQHPLSLTPAYLPVTEEPVENPGSNQQAYQENTMQGKYRPWHRNQARCQKN